MIFKVILDVGKGSVRHVYLSFEEQNKEGEVMTLLKKLFSLKEREVFGEIDRSILKPSKDIVLNVRSVEVMKSNPCLCCVVDDRGEDDERILCYNLYPEIHSSEREEVVRPVYSY